MKKKEFTNKTIQLQRQLRDYEIKRSTFSASILKQNVNCEKDSDEQNLLIIRYWKNNINNRKTREIPRSFFFIRNKLAKSFSISVILGSIVNSSNYILLDKEL